MSDEPRPNSVHFNWHASKGHALMTVLRYDGPHGYLTVTSALTLDGLRDLQEKLSACIADAEKAVPAAPARHLAPVPAEEPTRPSCSVCLHDTAECVCALRAATAKAAKDAESKQCMTCRVWTRVCCKLHREPVRS